ncbi:MAG: hypothetical protein ABI199_05880 [Bacteroidia bacterium]
MQFDNKEKMEREVENKFSDKQLNVVKISEKEIENNTSDFQLTDKNEIRYHGNMYDVVRQKKSDGFVYFYCIQDNREDTLNKALNVQVSMNVLPDSKNTNDNSKKLVKAFSKDYFPSINTILIHQSSKNIFFPLLFSHYSNASKDVLSPPPKIA